jgi:hypothetical protein
LSLALGLATTLALPLVKVVPDALPAPGGQPLLARYLGREETADWALRSAAAAGVRTVVVPSRSLMADLTWYGRDVALTLRALPPTGRPDHHWEMTAPFRPGVDPAPVALIWPEGHPSACAGASRIAGFAPPPGAYGGRRFVMFRLDTPDCLVAARATDG